MQFQKITYFFLHIYKKNIQIQEKRQGFTQNIKVVSYPGKGEDAQLTVINADSLRGEVNVQTRPVIAVNNDA